MGPAWTCPATWQEGLSASDPCWPAAPRPLPLHRSINPSAVPALQMHHNPSLQHCLSVIPMSPTTRRCGASHMSQ